MPKKYYTTFSHAFEEGHSGPAREYWNIIYGDPDNKDYHPRATMMLETRPDGQRYAERICYNLDQARELGRNDKAAEIRNVLGAAAVNQWER